MGLTYEGSCSGMLRVCHSHENGSDPQGNTICRKNVLGRKPLRLLVGNWDSAILSSLIAQILLMEQLQVPVELGQNAGEHTNYFVHDGSMVYSPTFLYYTSIAEAKSNPDCEGYPSFLSMDGANLTTWGCSHATLESWEKTLKLSFTTAGTLEELGNLGVLGKTGWFIPSFAVDANPSLASYRGYKGTDTGNVLKRPLRMREYCGLSSTVSAVCDAFAAEYVVGGELSSAAPPGVWESFYVDSLSDNAIETRLSSLSPPQAMPSPFYAGAFEMLYDDDGVTPIGHFAGVYCWWEEYDRQIIHDAGLKLKYHQYWSTELPNILSAGVANGEPVLFYWWEPDALHRKYTIFGRAHQISRVSLPEWSSSCEANRPNSSARCAGHIDSPGGGCDYPIQIVWKAVTPSLRSYSPVAYEGLKAFTLTNDDHERMLFDYYFQGSSIRQVACEWVRQNEEVWRPWFANLQDAECPRYDGQQCGGASRGACVYKEPPYPEGLCECLPGFSGAACENDAALECPPGSGVTIKGGAIVCEMCGAYEYSPSYDHSGCLSCPLGWFQLGENASACEPCPQSTYQPEKQRECVPCPQGLSSPPGTSKCDVCAPGYFRDDPPAECILCPLGATCEWNTTVRSMQIKSGFWRLSPLAVKIYKCENGVNGSTPCLAAGNAGDSICAAGHSGPLCRVCDDDHFYFKEGDCIECESAFGALTVGLAFLGVVLLVGGSLYLLHESRDPKLAFLGGPLRRAIHYSRAAFESIGITPKIKLALAFVQVIAAIDSTFNIGLPQTWFTWTAGLRFFGDLDWLGWLGPSTCLLGKRAATQLLVRAVIPLVVILAMPFLGGLLMLAQALVRATVGRRWEDKEPQRVGEPPRPRSLMGRVLMGANDGLPASLVLAFCFTPSVCSAIFRAWFCVSYDYNGEGERSYLDVELSVRCDNSQEHREILALAWVLVGVWPVGMVLMYAAVLFPSRAALLNEDYSSPSKLMSATEFLYRDYQPAFFWWEVLALLQRTSLTGWFALISSTYPFLRLLAALIATIMYLAVLLLCRPYRRRFDFGLAAAIQLLLVSIFIGGILVRLYEDIANDPSATPLLAQQVLGFGSSDQVVVVMIVAAFFMLVALAATLVIDGYLAVLKQMKEEQFSTCTMQPPSIKWKRKQIYACFLSHYKSEAASDARFIHDVLCKMLRAPVFLDSNALTDMRKLITDGVDKTDVLVLLATKLVLTRPWCLLELLETARRNIPVVIVLMGGGGFTVEGARHFARNLEGEMSRLNPSGLELLRGWLGNDFNELQEVLLAILEVDESKLITFDSHSTDAAMVATMKDVVEQMGKKVGQKVVWGGGRKRRSLAQVLSGKHGTSLAETQLRVRRRVGGRLRATRRHVGNTIHNASQGAKRTAIMLYDGGQEVRNVESAVFLITVRFESLQHARVLRSALEYKLGACCAIGGGADATKLLHRCRMAVVMLTKSTLFCPSVLFEIWLALSLGKPVASVIISGGGYDYAVADQALSDLPAAMERYSEGSALELQKLLPQSVSVAEAGSVIHCNLTSIIAVPWSPSMSQNRLESVLDDLIVKLPVKKSRPARRWRASRRLST